MTEKKNLVVGNWKMQLSHRGELELMRAVKDLIDASKPKAEVVVCPSYVSIPAIHEIIKDTAVGLGAQNVFWEEKGEYTGQVSVTHLKQFVKWAIVGHSEVRNVTGVTDEQVMQTAMTAKNHGMTPIVCIGETEAEHNQDQTVAKIQLQIGTLLETMDRSSLVQSVVAYEPIWAIGSGSMPDPDEVAQIILSIRKQITHRYDQETARRVRILYGGSVKPANAADYVGEPMADGLLVGGASTHPQQFSEIIKAVAEKVK